MPRNMHTRSSAVHRHAFVAFALVLNLTIIALAITTHRRDIFFSDSKLGVELEKTLPAIGAIVGAAIVTVNAVAITGLVTVYTKSLVVRQGITFAKLDHMHKLANDSVPLGRTPLVFAITLIIIAKAVLPSGIVASLTPTTIPWSSSGSMPSVEFSSDSGVTPNIWCEYYDGMVTNGSIGYGYGINCPIDSQYGQIYNAGLQSFWGAFPVNSSRDGTSYPSDLLGISGTISTLTLRYVSRITDDPNRAIIATDTFDTCVSRMVVNVTCARSLAEDQYWNMSYHTPIPGGVPQGMVQVSLCDNSTATSNASCSASRYAPHYSGGVIIDFWDMHPDTGNTTLSLYSFGSYATEMTSQSIQCQVGAHEEKVPIRITGGTSVQSWPSLNCPQTSPAPPVFLLNVTRMGDMSLIKMQGVDGVLEPISYVPNGTDRVYALQTALERMVATGATEMYATIDGNSSVHWAQTVEYTYTTSRTRLGSATGRSLGFIAGPVVLTTLIFIGWLSVGFDRNGDVYFNPLSPSNIAAAATRANVDLDTAAGQRQLDRLSLLLKYGQVSDGRNGLNVVEPPADERDSKGWPLLAIVSTSKSWEQDHKFGGEEGQHWDPADLYKGNVSW